MTDLAGTRLSADSGLRTLDPNAITAWRVTWALVSATALAIWIAFLAAIHFLTEVDRLPLLILLGIAGVIGAITVTWLEPLITWRHWRYDIREDEVELRSGLFTRTMALIPMSRVQLVDIRQGPIDRWFDLATITIYTAGGQREIPGIAASEAEPLRNRIASLANIHDDL